MRVSPAGRSRQLALVEDSPLRHADPRTKLFLSLAISLVVMTSIERLLIFLGVYVLFLLWARLFIPTVEHIWRLKWVLILLFFLDWWLISLDHAMLICLRLILLTGVFALFFSTTNTRELGLALEKLRVPYRYAFSLSLAFQSLGLLDDEWRAIREAQSSRGALPNVSSFWKFITNVGDLISLTVPAIVLTTKRAWAITEASYARGFDSPHRVSYHSLSFTRLDLLLITGTINLLILLFWRW
ncbi:MAG TPA: energy-coupling factor transporter transmembrane component T [Anaerolineales bacterium]|nr:energy-coupling factor transporter transmembrane component T [Anaerolineales bacterium]HNN12789.1 energy-coupling factor transporter transmembrane component T [Anaerolineales bacterium]HNO31565.1 energy-coupling factor transporter transmembrane component T [Anaerolineales bacterium]